MDRLKQICIELANLAKREHYFCEDGWYSCPKAEGGCANDAEGDECNCGADAYNAKVNEMLAAALTESEPERLTVQEISDLPQRGENYIAEDRDGEIQLDGYFSRADLQQLADSITSNND